MKKTFILLMVSSFVIHAEPIVEMSYYHMKNDGFSTCIFHNGYPDAIGDIYQLGGNGRYKYMTIFNFRLT